MICTLSFCTFTAVSSLALSTKSFLLLKTTLKMALGVQFDIWGWLKAPSKRFFYIKVSRLTGEGFSIIINIWCHRPGLAISQHNFTIFFKQHIQVFLIQLTQVHILQWNQIHQLDSNCTFLFPFALIINGKVKHAYCAQRGLDTPVLVQIAKEFSFFLCYIYCKNKVWQNPQTLKLGTSPNPSPLVAAAENIPQVLPFRHQFENLRPCVVDVRCEEPDTVASLEKRWAQDGWRKDWYVSSVHSD